MSDKFNKIIFRIIDWSLYLIVFLVPIYFAWFHENYSVFDLNKAVILRLLLLITVIALIVRGAAQGKIYFHKFSLLTIAWLSLLIFSLLSALSSLHPQLSFLGSYERQQGLNTLWAYFLWFILVVTFCRERLIFKKFLWAANLSVAVASLYGLLQLFHLDFLRWSGESANRIFSTLGQPNFFGHFIVVMIPLTVYSIFYLGKKLLSRWLLGGLLIAELVCLVFTYSRGAWLALIITILLAVIFSLGHFGKRWLSYALLSLSIIGAILIFWPGVRSSIVNKFDTHNLSVVSRIASALDFNSGSTSARLGYWQAGWSFFIKAPWPRKFFGFGPETEASVFVNVYQIDWGYYERLNSFPDRAHNFILDILLQFGLVGLLAWGFLLFIILKPLFKKLFVAHGDDYWLSLALVASVTAYAINNLFSFSLVTMSVIFYWLLAMSYSFGQNFNLAKDYSIPLLHSVSRWLITAIGLVFLVLMFFAYNIKPLVADTYYLQVKKAEVLKDCRQVVINMEKTMSWYPLSNYYRRIYLLDNVNCLSAVNSAAGQKQITSNVLEEISAFKAKEVDYYDLIEIAHTYSIFGYYVDAKYYQLAEEYYRKLLGINHNITVVYQDYGRLRLWQGRLAEARKIFNEGIKVTPDLARADPNSEHTKTIASQLGYFKYLLGLTFYYEKDFNQAEKEYQESLKLDPKLTAAYKDLADIAYKNKDFDLAISYDKKAFAIDEANSFWPFTLANIYWDKGDKALALSYALIAKDLEPNSQSIQDFLNKIQAKKK